MLAPIGLNLALYSGTLQLSISYHNYYLANSIYGNQCDRVSLGHSPSLYLLVYLSTIALTL